MRVIAIPNLSMGCLGDLPSQVQVVAKGNQGHTWYKTVQYVCGVWLWKCTLELKGVQTSPINAWREHWCDVRTRYNYFPFFISSSTQPDNYVAFGISGSDQAVQMVGGDVTWAWLDTRGSMLKTYTSLHTLR